MGNSHSRFSRRHERNLEGHGVFNATAYDRRHHAARISPLGRRDQSGRSYEYAGNPVDEVSSFYARGSRRPPPRPHFWDHPSTGYRSGGIDPRVMDQMYGSRRRDHARYDDLDHLGWDGRSRPRYEEVHPAYAPPSARHRNKYGNEDIVLPADGNRYDYGR